MNMGAAAPLPGLCCCAKAGSNRRAMTAVVTTKPNRFMVSPLSVAIKDILSTARQGIRLPGGLWRNEPPQQKRIDANADVQHCEHPQRERPKDDPADPSLN